MTMTEDRREGGARGTHKISVYHQHLPQLQNGEEDAGGEDLEIIDAEENPDMAAVSGSGKAPTLVITDGEHLKK